MTALAASTVPIAVRVRNTRYDGMITGYLHGAPKFQKADPGGYKSASFTIDQRLGYRSDMIQPYSRIYFYNKLNGKTVFEGDIAHPGRSIADDGPLLDVTVEGGVERLNDWSGQRIFIDTDMQAWVQSSQNTIGATLEVGDDRAVGGTDALTLGFPNSFHVEQNYRAEAVYYRIRDAGQELGRFNYSWDCGLTNASWRIRSIFSPPSFLSRDQAATLSGSGGSGAVVGGSIPVGANLAFLQMLWNSTGSNTGTADTVWTSFLAPTVVARLHLQDGTFKTTGYVDWLTADVVCADLLGSLLTSTFDGANAKLDAGTGYNILQLAYPDGVTPRQVLDDLMTFEPSCTYIVGASMPGVDKYSFQWLSRTNVPRYEFCTWIDDYQAGPQSVDQYNEVVTRWKSPTGLSKSTTMTQSIPEMTAMGRTRRFFQDLSDSVSSSANATQATSNTLNDHRFPQNGGQVTVSRPVVDLWTGRRVPPSEIDPAYLCRIVGVSPSRDALNNNPRNGSTLCRIVTTDYDAASDSVTVSLDSEPWSMFRAIAAAKPTTTTPQRKAL